jgi:hypothetical protein
MTKRMCDDRPTFSRLVSVRTLLRSTTTPVSQRENNSISCPCTMRIEIFFSVAKAKSSYKSRHKETGWLDIFKHATSMTNFLNACQKIWRAIHDLFISNCHQRVFWIAFPFSGYTCQNLEKQSQLIWFTISLKSCFFLIDKYRSTY